MWTGKIKLLLQNNIVTAINCAAKCVEKATNDMLVSAARSEMFNHSFWWFIGIVVFGELTVKDAYANINNRRYQEFKKGIGYITELCRYFAEAPIVNAYQ